jgi:signal transduction histidine kinase
MPRGTGGGATMRRRFRGFSTFGARVFWSVDGDIPSEVRRPLTDMHDSGKHLLRLINDVLDLSKIEAGRMELALGDYSVHDTIAAVRASLGSLAAERAWSSSSPYPTVSRSRTNFPGSGLPLVLELFQEGSKVTGSMRIGGYWGHYGGPVEGRVTGDVFQFSHLSHPIKGEATVDGDEMKGQLVFLGMGEFRLRRVDRSVPTRP